MPTQDLRSPRSPSASAPTPDSGSPRWEPDQSCRLNALCALYPGSRRCPSAWRSVVPWRSQAREGQDSATLGGPGRAWVLRTPPPGRAERVLPMRSRKPDESPAGPGNPLGHWPLAGTTNDNEQDTCPEPWRCKENGVQTPHAPFFLRKPQRFSGEPLPHCIKEDQQSDSLPGPSSPFSKCHVWGTKLKQNPVFCTCQLCEADGLLILSELGEYSKPQQISSGFTSVGLLGPLKVSSLREG